jgi:hypothetical protein
VLQLLGSLLLWDPEARASAAAAAQHDFCRLLSEEDRAAGRAELAQRALALQAAAEAAAAAAAAPRGSCCSSSSSQDGSIFFGAEEEEEGEGEGEEEEEEEEEEAEGL